ncbi:MAG: hypothetical protein KDK38_14425 [Leptospiraceae bacterium]|nr:hypothetical protein [Leptospiraceae bacterium]
MEPKVKLISRNGITLPASADADVSINIPNEGDFYLEEIQVIQDPNDTVKLFAGIDIKYNGLNYTENHVPTNLFSVNNDGHARNDRNWRIKLPGGSSFNLQLRNFRNAQVTNLSVVLIGYFE